MSHTVKIQAQFKTEHLSAFKHALDHFGWKIKENAKTRTYPGDEGGRTVYPMVGVNPNDGYDIGIKFNEKTGELEVMGDFFGGSISTTLGNNLDKLKQEYSCCVAEDYFSYMGWSATRQVNQDGTITLEGEQS